LYVRPFAFGAPTGGNAPCLNMVGTLSTISSHYKIEKQDSGNGQQCCQSTARRNKIGMHKVRIVSLSPKAWHLGGPEETAVE
ncbi:hypothetical protein T12_1770, partial [Trichinella patagoniensis]